VFTRCCSDGGGGHVEVGHCYNRIKKLSLVKRKEIGKRNIPVAKTLARDVNL
jgi:hypothetical protein